MRFLVILFALLSLVSCAPDSGSRDVLDVAVSQEPPTFDVHVNSSQIARYVMAGNVFERLVTLNGEGRAVPELCSSFEPVNGSRGWIFHLREGVRFHNGQIMTSEDVVLSMNRWIDYNAAVASMLDGARFTAVDGNTVRIDAQEPILFLPEMMAGSPQAAVVYAREMFDSLDGDGLVTEYIGTGPYRFVSWERGSSIRLERFEDYCPYGGQMDGLAGFKHAYIPVIIYHFVPDSFARTTGCETGLYDFINDVMNDDIPRLEENDDLVVSRGEEAGSVVILFNKRQGLCADQYVRTAVNMAVDLDVPMAACYGGGGYVMHPDYMEGNQQLWAVTDSEPRYDAGDKEGARRMLSENGYDGTPVRILTSNLSNLDRFAIALASELEAAGFNTELIVVDWAAMMAWREDPSRWDLCITAMTQVALPSLKLFLSPVYAGWSDDEVLQGMMEAFSRSTSISQAQETWREIQDYCYDYLPAIVCGHYLSGYLYRTDLCDVNETGGFYFFNSRLT